MRKKHWLILLPAILIAAAAVGVYARWKAGAPPPPQTAQGDRMFVLEHATPREKGKRMSYVLLRADGTAVLGTPVISGTILGDCTWAAEEDELLVYAAMEAETEAIARFTAADGGKTLVFREASVALFATQGARYVETTRK
jgi:hypothetical protein